MRSGKLRVGQVVAKRFLLYVPDRDKERGKDGTDHDAYDAYALRRKRNAVLGFLQDAPTIDQEEEHGIEHEKGAEEEPCRSCSRRQGVSRERSHTARQPLARTVSCLQRRGWRTGSSPQFCRPCWALARAASPGLV